MRQPEVPIRLLSLIEATTVTGPARNLISFCRTVHASPKIEISVLVLGDRGQSEPSRFVQTARELGIDVEAMEENRRFDWRVLGRLREVIARRRPNIIETHSVKSHFLVKLLGPPKSCPWVAFHHGYTTPDLKMRMYNQLDRWSLRAAKKVISLSTAFKKQLIAVGVEEQKICVVGSSIDANWNSDPAPATVPELRQRWGLQEHERIILSVGRLSREKGHIDLIRAFAQLQQPNLRLLIIGDGPERARLESEAISLGIADRVTMPGHIDDVAPVYQLADVFVLPSFSEGSPLALLEAMVSGVPAVATTVGGIREMVTAECAVLTEPGNPNALAKAISRVLSDPGIAKRLRINAREAAVNNYGPDSRACKLLEVYEEALR